MPTKGLSNAREGDFGLRTNNILQDCLVCGVVVVDVQHRIVSITAEAAKALRLPAVQKQGHSAESLPDPLPAMIREVRKTGQPVAGREIALAVPGEKPAALSITVVPASSGREAGCIVLLHDLSARAKLEQHLHRLDRLASVGTLSASMAHEIKNALVSVRTFIDLLLEKNPDAELAGTVRREMERVDSIVSHMLKYSAPAQPAFSAVRLHTILDHSWRLVAHRAGDKLITFNRDFQAAADSFHGDDHQLEQAFVNLLINGVEAIGAEGTLSVGTDLVPDETVAELREGTGLSQLLRVRISDTGAGIPGELMRRIFEPFFTTKQDGTGLGLAVTRRIIEEHNGDIRVESQPGKGTTFTVLLPTGAQNTGPRGVAQ
jgi:nitrogen-specific signal transduction histidine kinase